MIKVFSVAILTMMLLIPTGSWAKPVEIDLSKSALFFQINHEAGFTLGTFDHFTATADLNDEGTQIQSIQATIDMASINTRNAIRDEGLKSDMFFDSTQFPQAHFESTSSAGDEITGQLMLKGFTQPITLKAVIDTTTVPSIITLKGSFNRHDYGITYNATYPRTKQKVIGDTVDVTVTLATK